MVAGNKLLTQLKNLLIECEQSKIIPTSVIINNIYLKILTKSYPLLFRNNNFIDKKHGNIKIIETESNYLGVGLVFDHFDVLHSNSDKKRIN